MHDSATYQTIARAIAFLRDRQSAQPDLADVAAHVHLSKYHLQRLFTEWAGVSPKAYLQYLTTERAKASLLAGRSTLATAYAGGLSGSSRLHDHFVKVAGCSPGDFARQHAGVELTYRGFETSFGPAVAVETPRGIAHLAFLSAPEEAETEVRQHFPEARLRSGTGPQTERVIQYFQEQTTPPRPIGLDLRGTPFQLQVWQALLRIPEGEAVAYGDLAQAIGRPTASRAVGTAIGKNPIAYLIPCHRVIRGDGTSGGYRWGAERKVILNGWEAARSGR
ncbi:Bifunctional transcriptional activator/DNA repair enzyme Ada [Neolewinella maritima]|uniref:Bifunctional transcriptional activator/DNA repair enzyme Ada n=1 Tax=Neolewinella maritima TaxID=1383882 RepID=A0ABN8F051_9BACT|nr:methylated-DNA--[protein]-cysteine S-methyltransferase [Neolewinella maritima]CAH0999170.1 Bifunctional transcriptional activator/DNA repair enzyme Ada [Neolewinella maritima]